MTAPGDATRARILEAAWAKLEECGTADLTIAQIAAAAGVTRQLVYFHFANRAGLLTAMARHRDQASGFADAAAASRHLPPLEGLAHLLRAWCAYMPEILPVSIALETALVNGQDGGVAWRDRMDELREALRIALDRIARRGQLAPGWSVDTAADWAWSRIQPTTWRHLVSERGWSTDHYTDQTVQSLLAQLVRV